MKGSFNAVWSRCVCLAVLAICCAPPFAHAGPAVIDGRRDMYGLGEYAEILYDPSEELTISDVRSPEWSDRFHFVEGIFTFSLDEGATWVRISFNSEVEGEYYLKMGECYGGQIVVHGFVNGFPVQSLASSNLDGSSVFSLKKGEQIAFYARVRTKYGFFLHPELVGRDAFSESKIRSAIFFGSSMGILGGLLLYNLFLAFSIRDRSLWYYLLHVLASIMYLALFTPNGFEWYRFLGGGLEYLRQNWSAFFVVSLLMFSDGLFSREFLKRSGHTWVFRILTAQMFASIGLYWFFWGVDNRIASDVVSIFAPVSTLAIIGCGLYCVWKGSRSARIFVLAWTVYMAGGITYSMVWRNVLEPSWLTLNGLALGIIGEVVLLAFAMAHRIQTLRMQRDSARKDRVVLAQQNALQEAVLEGGVAGLALAVDRKLEWANARFRGMFGLEPRAEDIPEALETPGDTARDLVEFRGKARSGDGSMMHFKAFGKNVNRDDRDWGTVWMVEDISNSVRLEELRKEYFRIMEHDLKGPLAGMSMAENALALAGDLTPEQRKLCSYIRETSDRMLGKVNFTLEMQALEDGKLTGVKEGVDFPALVRQAAQGLAPMVAAKDIRLDMSGYVEAGGASFVTGNPSLLKAMVRNVLANAVQASPEHATVVVRMEYNGGPSLTVRNSGADAGLNPETVFEPHATLAKPDGTGLGAYHARIIAQAHGGEMRAAMPEPGVFEVSIRLPGDGGKKLS